MCAQLLFDRLTVLDAWPVSALFPAQADFGSLFNTTVGTLPGANKETAFRFAREGKVNVVYWVESPFGHAISAADQAALARGSGEVYRQPNATVR